MRVNWEVRFNSHLRRRGALCLRLLMSLMVVFQPQVHRSRHLARRIVLQADRASNDISIRSGVTMFAPPEASPLGQEAW